MFGCGLKCVIWLQIKINLVQLDNLVDWRTMPSEKWSWNVDGCRIFVEKWLQVITLILIREMVTDGIIQLIYTPVYVNFIHYSTVTRNDTNMPQQQHH